MIEALPGHPADQLSFCRQSDGPQAQRLLHNHRAYPLTGELIYVSADAGISRIRNENSHCSVMLKDHLARVNPETKLTVFINGRRIKSASAAGPGDTLTFAGSDTVYRFINVLGV